jgi:hypothetical protein
MYLHKFSKDDILINVLKTHPQTSFKIYAGKVWDSEYSENVVLPENCGDGTAVFDFSCSDNSYNIAIGL